MAYRTFDDETKPKLLGQALSAAYTEVWTKAFADAERVLYILIGHASVDITFDIKIASDSSGTGATSILSAAVTCDTAGQFWTFEADAAQMTSTLVYISPVTVLTAGTYTLLEVKRGLRNQGNITHDSTYESATKALG